MYKHEKSKKRWREWWSWLSEIQMSGPAEWELLDDNMKELDKPTLEHEGELSTKFSTKSSRDVVDVTEFAETAQLSLWNQGYESAPLSVEMKNVKLGSTSKTNFTSQYKKKRSSPWFMRLRLIKPTLEHRGEPSTKFSSKKRSSPWFKRLRLMKPTLEHRGEPSTKFSSKSSRDVVDVTEFAETAQVSLWNQGYESAPLSVEMKNVKLGSTSKTNFTSQYKKIGEMSGPATWENFRQMEEMLDDMRKEFCGKKVTKSAVANLKAMEVLTDMRLRPMKPTLEHREEPSTKFSSKECSDLVANIERKLCQTEQILQEQGNGPLCWVYKKTVKRSACNTKIPGNDKKEKRFEETTLRGSLHKIHLQEAAQCIRIQPWDDEPDHIVEIDFPEMAVLGERQLGIEIMNTKNFEFEEDGHEAFRNKQILTDVVQITQSSHASFLRPVTVRIPLHQEYKNWGRTERTDRYGRKIKIENGITQITSFVFSPACIYYDEIEEVVDALVLGDEIDQMFHLGGIYLIVEQEINIDTPALNISFKPFFSFQEHESCRVARNVFIALVNAEEYRAKITFTLEWDPKFIASVDGSFERDLTFRIGQREDRQSWSGKKRLRYEFQERQAHDTNLKLRFTDDEKNFSLLNMADLLHLRESAERFIPSRRDLYLCLNSIPERYGWLNFMQDCLGIDKMNFREFVYKDVLDTNRNRDPNLQLDESDIDTKFERHMHNLTIEHFKSEVFRVSSDRLTNDNLEQLAEALRYVDGSRLRDALRIGLETHSINLNGTSRNFQEWVGDDDGGTEFRRADSL